MTHHDADDNLRILRSLDPANPPRPDAAQTPEAQELLGRILRTPVRGSGAPDRHPAPSPTRPLPSADKPLASTGQRRTPTPRRRWAVAAAAVAAVVAGGIVVNLLSTPQHAFATWTAVPDPVPAAAAEEIGAQCTSEFARERFGQEVLIAEERGRITFVATVSQYNLRYCLLIDGEFRFSGSGSIRESDTADLAPDDGWAAVGGSSGIAKGDSFSVLLGHVGDNVVGVDIHPLASRERQGVSGELPESVTATVSGNNFGAWWPGATEDYEITLHLADGTTVPRQPAFEYER